MWGFSEILEDMLERDQSCSYAANEDYERPVDIASTYRHVEIVQKLIEFFALNRYKRDYDVGGMPLLCAGKEWT